MSTIYHGLARSIDMGFAESMDAEYRYNNQAGPLDNMSMLLSDMLERLDPAYVPGSDTDD